MDTLETPAERADRYRAWLTSFGFTARDWRRIKALAEAVTSNHIPAAIEDLDAPYRVQAMPRSHARWSSGQLLGAHNRNVLLAWPKTKR